MLKRFCHKKKPDKSILPKKFKKHFLFVVVVDLNGMHDEEVADDGDD